MTTAAPFAPAGTRTVSVAVAGNPNSGKTTIFNGLTGSSQRIGNWPGVTVEKISGSLIGSAGSVEVVDLPGIYSLDAVSEDERVASHHILEERPDLVINIVDASNLERNLYLTLTLIEMKRPLLVVLTMMDIAERRRIRVDVDGLSRRLGVPVIGINAHKASEIARVREAVNIALGNPSTSPLVIPYPDAVESILTGWADRLADAAGSLGMDVRLAALKILEEDEIVIEEVTALGALDRREIRDGVREVEGALGDSPDIAIAESKYILITNLAGEVRKQKRSRVSNTERIDRVVTSKALGIPVFLAVMYLLFWTVTHLGGAFIDFFDIAFGTLFVDGAGALLERIGAPVWLIALLADGVGAGIQTVATFIPVIFMMFFMLSLLEDSGYMARAAFVMDRFMRMIGLPGKAFVPMLVGFGCTVPAVMATRTLENRKDRFLTIFMVPFMSCGARLPVYALFGAAFFGARSGVMVFSLYTTGILLAVLTGLLLKKTLFKGEAAPFVMELPPYHAPRMGHILGRTWMRLKMFLCGAGRVIVLAVLVLTFLNSLGRDGSFGNQDSEDSVLATIGKAVTPVFTPLGVERENWPATVGLFTGVFAKEAIVGTVSSLYGQIDAASAASVRPGEPEGEFDLAGGLREAAASIPASLAGIFRGFSDPLGTEASDVAGVTAGSFSALRRHFSHDWTRAYGYLLFVLLYFPCLAAMGTIFREVGLKFGWLAVVYLTILAWSVATLFFQIVTGHSVPLILFSAGLPFLFIPVFNLITGRGRSRRGAAGGDVPVS